MAQHISIEAHGLGVISVDPATLRLIGRDHRFALYERLDGGALLVTLQSSDLLESYRRSTQP